MNKLNLPFETPLWFQNRVLKVMEHNEYSNDMITASACEAKGRWSPVDLILREHYNNDDGSAKGFCGLTPAQSRQAYEYVKANQEDFKNADLYHKDGWNHWGFKLWSGYKLN